MPYDDGNLGPGFNQANMWRSLIG